MPYIMSGLYFEDVGIHHHCIDIVHPSSEKKDRSGPPKVNPNSSIET